MAITIHFITARCQEGFSANRADFRFLFGKNQLCGYQPKVECDVNAGCAPAQTMLIPVKNYPCFLVNHGVDMVIKAFAYSTSEF